MLLDGVGSGKGLVDCATLQAGDMLEMSEQWSNRGGRFLEAPVSGSKGPAAQGSLVFLTAGSESLSRDVSKYLDVMGKKTFYFGTDVTLNFKSKNRNEMGSDLSLGTRLMVLSKRLGRKRSCDATPDCCHGGVSYHYLFFAL